jgi:hypothetical protein
MPVLVQREACSYSWQDHSSKGDEWGNIPFSHKERVSIDTQPDGSVVKTSRSKHLGFYNHIPLR